MDESKAMKYYHTDLFYTGWHGALEKYITTLRHEIKDEKKIEEIQEVYPCQNPIKDLPNWPV